MGRGDYLARTQGGYSRPSRPSSSRQPGISSSNNRQTGTNSNSGENTRNRTATVQTPKGMNAQQQAAMTLKQAGAVTYGGLSGQGLWSKSPVLYEERLKKSVGPAGQYEEETDRFDPTSERIGQVDLSKTTVGGTEDLTGLTPYYSTMHPDAVNTGNAKWKAEMKALSEGKTEEEALAIGDEVNEIFNKAIAGRDRGDYTQ